MSTGGILGASSFLGAFFSSYLGFSTLVGFETTLYFLIASSADFGRFSCFFFFLSFGAFYLLLELSSLDASLLGGFL
jgi:hypothetical protein